LRVQDWNPSDDGMIMMRERTMNSVRITDIAPEGMILVTIEMEMSVGPK
jgi:hypothetical protein